VYLRRQPAPTYVDLEGSVVWIQEYLRYRVNLCSHTESVARVMMQIDGLEARAPCGTTDTPNFPPRDESLNFMIQLEAKYRDGLRRSAISSYVDLEGNIVWTQEYLRYRVSGCAHDLSLIKVFGHYFPAGGSNIDPCDNFSARISAGNGSRNTHGMTMPRSGSLQVTLEWDDPTVDLDLYLTPGGCSRLLDPRRVCVFGDCGCYPAAASARAGVNIERLQYSVGAGATYTIWVDDFTAAANRPTTYRVRFVVSSSSGVAAASQVVSTKLRSWAP